MKAPEQFDPSKSSAQNGTPPDAAAPHGKLAKSPAIPAGTPTIKQTHKQTAQSEKQPFQWQFLLPKYWAIWLLLALVVPLVYLPLRWQFWLGRKLGILFYKMLASRRRDTLINLRLAFLTNRKLSVN